MARLSRAAAWIALICACTIVLPMGLDDDVTVMLSVRSFTRTDAQQVDPHHDAKAANDLISNTIADNRRALEEQLQEEALPSEVAVAESVLPESKLFGFAKPETPAVAAPPASPTLVDSAHHKERAGGTSIFGQPMLWIAVLICALVVAAGCACFFLGRKGRARQRAPKSGPRVWNLKETWTKLKQGDEGVTDRLKALFARLDEIEQSDDSPPGFITAQDLNTAVNDPDIEDELTRLGLFDEDAEPLFELFQLLAEHGDRDADGLVSLDEFLGACVTHRDTLQEREDYHVPFAHARF